MEILEILGSLAPLRLGAASLRSAPLQASPAAPAGKLAPALGLRGLPTSLGAAKEVLGTTKEVLGITRIY